MIEGRLSEMTSGKLAVSILICTRDRSELLKGCLSSVLACRPAAKEIVIVDQSRDGSTRDVVRFYQGAPTAVHYVRSHGEGLSRAKNEGFSHCSSPILAFTDDDCRVDPDWLDSLTQPIRTARAEASVGKTLPGKRSGGLEETRSFYAPEGPREFSRHTHPWRVGGGGNFAMLRCALEEVGLFDERFGPGSPLQSAEDMDLVHRLLRSGRKLVYVPTAQVWHRSWRSPRENRFLARGYGVGAGGYFTKYFLAGSLLSGWRFGARAGVRLAWGAAAVLRGDWRGMVEQGIYLMGLFEGVVRYISLGRKKRRTVPQLGRGEA